MNYSALIYAYRKKNVAVTGKGKLDGQAGNDKWFEWAWVNPPHTKAQAHSLEGGRSKQQLGQWAASDTPVELRVLGAGHYLRPNFIQFYEPKNSSYPGAASDGGGVGRTIRPTIRWQM